MARFNSSARGTTIVPNVSGSAAVAIHEPNYKLYTMVASNFVTDRFYQDAGNNLRALRKVISDADPIFVAKLAVYARKNLNLRTAPLVLMIELAKIHSGDNLVSRGLYGSICRADELAEVLAYYKVANGYNDLKKLSKQVSKGIARAFHKFDAYQFAKYRGRNKEISLRDAMFVTHPIPKDERQKGLFKQIAEDTLAPADTWERRKSAAGQQTSNASEKEKQAASRETWESMIESLQMGYMAMLRNLRNFLEDDVSDYHIDLVCNYLTNPKAVENSKQLPFRFYTAYRELNEAAGGLEPKFEPIMGNLGSKRVAFELMQFFDANKVRKILKAIKAAGLISVRNLKVFEKTDRVVSIVDVSGSMAGSTISSSSTVRPIEVAAFYGAIMHHLNPSCRLGYFGTKFGMERDLEVNPFILPTKHRELSGKYGHGTMPEQVFKELTASRVVVDKLVIWSDMQFWNSGGIHLNGNAFMRNWEKYKKEIAPHCKLYLIDTVGYGGTTPVRIDGDVIMINGFSSETFKTIGNMTNAKQIIEEIMAINI